MTNVIATGARNGQSLLPCCQCVAPSKSFTPKGLRLVRHGPQTRTAIGVIIAEVTERLREGGVTRRDRNATTRAFCQVGCFAVHGADP
jgi:hypothetical protein